MGKFDGIVNGELKPAQVLVFSEVVDADEQTHVPRWHSVCDRFQQSALDGQIAVQLRTWAFLRIAPRDKREEQAQGTGNRTSSYRKRSGEFRHSKHLPVPNRMLVRAELL
ncbi:MAG: hypothetical protein ACKO38_05240 [Planctomycetota bacterium]